MTKHFLFLFLCAFFVGSLFAQRKSKLNSNGKGTLFVYAGLTKISYANSTISFFGEDFNFDLANTSLQDTENSETFFDFNSENATLQFSAHLGYYILPKWALTIGVDKMNVFMSEEQNTRISGSFAPESHSSFEGNYDNVALSPSREEIYYRQSLGTHYVRLGFLKSGQHSKTSNASFELLSHVGAGVGFLFSNADFTFDGLTSQQNRSISGFGINGIAGVRAVFAQHVFLQFNLSGGLLSHRSIVLHPLLPRNAQYNSFYLAPELSLGISLFVRPTDCGTCPKW